MLSIGAAHAADLPMATKAPVAPPPPVSGYLEIYTGGAWNHEDEIDGAENSHAWVIGGAGRVNYWFAPGASAQFDVQADGASYTGQTSGPSRFSATDYLIAAHVNWRDPGHLVGIFAGAGDASQDEVVNASSTAAIRHGLIGVEGQLYWNQLTLYGQGGYDSTIGSITNVPGGIDSVHAWFVRGTARYYINPDLRLEGTVQYDNGAHDFSAGVPSLDFDMVLWRGKIEYKFPNSPFAIFGAYQGTRMNLDVPGETETVTDQRVTAGFRIYLNEDTLHFNDVRGATLDIIDPIGLLAPSLN
ncbi:MAG TPA: hypothetical protein VLX44_20020 [Xanthobacteraceae bacterium]|nr:hypothetical protein [Xanthobacteraceae bacterium]